MSQTNASLRLGWMGHLQDNQRDVLLIDLTIPGTHDTGTWKLDNQGVPAISKCQQWTLQEQLDHGIRFIDIRLVPELNDQKNDLRLYHGSADCKVWFSEVVQTCREFLNDNGTETVIMSIKNEGDVPDADFNAALDPFLNNEMQQQGSEKLFYTSGIVPLLSQSKGKIVLFRRYHGSGAGIKATTGWPHDNVTNRPVNGHPWMMIQDVYGMSCTSAEKKWTDFIRKFLVDAQGVPLPPTPNDVWWINFTSASGGLWPATFAASINTRLQEWLEAEFKLTSGTGARFGTIAMDFPSPRVVDLLIAWNVAHDPTVVSSGPAYKIRLANNKAGIGESYFYYGNRYNYPQAYQGGSMGHALNKVGGNPDLGRIYSGDTVRLHSTQFTNDDYVYICEDPGNLDNSFYGQYTGEGDPNTAVWAIERITNDPDVSVPIEFGETVRFRNMYSPANYLCAMTNKWVSTIPLDTRSDYILEGGFDWTIEA